MATLTEFGNKFPCSTEGAEVPITDQISEMYSGDVMEVWIEADKDIMPAEAFACLWNILRMKEQYPHFVLHYFKVESRKITVQYSVAPTGQEASPWLVAVVIAIAIVAIIGLLVTAAVLKWTRGYVWYPVGWAAITAKDVTTEHGISGVKVYVDGTYAGTTDGYSVNKKLRIGQHTFSARPIEGYQDPYPVQATIDLNKTTPVTIYFRPIGSPEPDTGWLDISTSPSGGEVFVNSQSVGPSPVSVELPAPGDYNIAFGDIEGYFTPQARQATLIPGARTSVSVEYEPVGKQLWEKYVLYGLIGAGIIAGAAIVAPRVIKALKEK